MNEPGDVRGPRWFARPIVWLCGSGLLLLLIGLAAWWAARTGVRAMQRRGAVLSWEVSDVAYWAEEHLGISTDVWMWDGNVTLLEIGIDGSDQSDFDDVKMLELCRFPKLNWLILCDVSATDAGIAQLVDAGGLRQVTFLCLFDCPSLTGRSLATLGRLQNVEDLTLDADFEPISGADLREFSQLSSLTTYEIPWSNSDLDSIVRLSKLRALSLDGTLIDDAGLAALAHCPQLTELDLSCSHVTDAGVVEIARHCPNLAVLWLDGTHVTDACLSVVAQMPKLEELYVGDTAVMEAAAKRIMAAHPRVVVTADGESEE